MSVAQKQQLPAAWLAGTAACNTHKKPRITEPSFQSSHPTHHMCSPAYSALLLLRLLLRLQHQQGVQH